MKDDLDSFAERLVTNAIQQSAGQVSAVVPDPRFLRTVASFAPALMNLIRESQGLGPSVTMTVELDEDDINRALPALKIVIQGKEFDAAWLLTTAMNAYRRKEFPAAPELLPGRVRPMMDENSLIVQAADVLGNFAMNFVFWKLGITSRGKIRKAEIFDRVFGGRVESTEFVNQITISGNKNQDLKLINEGQAAFRLRWEVTN